MKSIPISIPLQSNNPKKPRFCLFQIFSIFISYPELSCLKAKSLYVALRYFKISHNMLCYILFNSPSLGWNMFKGAPPLFFVINGVAVFQTTVFILKRKVWRHAVLCYISISRLCGVTFLIFCVLFCIALFCYYPEESCYPSF